MGTRNLTVVVKDGTHKIAQYGQWDGYPSGVGADILTFLADPTNVEALRSIADRVHFAAEGEEEALLTELAPDLAGKEWFTSEESDRFNSILPSLTRNHGGKILQHLVTSDDPHSLILTDSFSFGEDSLFCEWAYVVDLDANTLECYQGFQHEPHTDGRWSYFVPEGTRNGGPYYGVKLVKTYALADLPDETTFCSELEPATEDDDES